MKKLACFIGITLLLAFASNAYSQELPAGGWTGNATLGDAAAGDATADGDTFTVTGNGSDIQGTADHGQFLYKEMIGDGAMSCRVTSNGTGSNAWCKGGIMIRQNTDADSMNALMPITGGNGNGSSWQWRLTNGGGTAYTNSGPVVEIPYYVKIERVGNSVSGSYSPDGTTWTQLGASQTIDFGETALIGLAVTSHAGGELRTYTFDSLAFSGGVSGLGDPGNASSPLPESESNDILRDGDLSWTPGAYPATHNLYIGSSFEDVNNATVAAASGLVDSAYDPGRLDLGATYFWRVDEVNTSADRTVHKGNIWSFEVEPYSIQIPGADIIATASSFSNESSLPEKTIDGSGLSETGVHSIASEAMWFTEINDPTPWIQFEFDNVKKLDTMKVWNSNSSAEGFIGYGVNNVQIEYSTDGETWEVFADANEFSRAPGLPTYNQNDEIALGGLAAKMVRLNIQSNWGGFMKAYSLSEVQFTMIPAAARTPDPASESVDILPNAVVSWRAGREAAQSTVYVGTDPNEVADGIAPSATSNTHSIDLSSFDLGMSETYYWRVDEVNNAEADSVWAGPVWSFSTVAAVVVDDFESYGNDSPDRPFQAWLDGYGYSADKFFLAEYNGNGTGAGVGHDIWSVASQHYNGDIMETANTMPGSMQSMPLYYSNSGGVASQTERTFAVPQDWTVGGAQTLSIAFAGQTGNTGTLYVKINNTKITYPRDPGNIAKGVTWQAWNIDLSSMDVQAVTTIQIGVDGSGASGMLLIDDIKLHPEAGVVITPAAPSDDNLVGAWSFDEGSGTTAADSSGNGHNGTIVDGIFEAGQVGSALVFDGLTSVVTLPAAAWDTIENQVTACFWAYVDSSITQDPVTFAAYQDLTVNDSRVISAHLIWSNGNIYFDAGGSVAETYDRISKGASAAVYGDAWIHWAFVKNVDTGMMKVYRNGILWLSGSDLVRPMTGVTAFTLGATAKDQVDFWKGSMDEFKLYNTELTQEEILSLAGQTAPIDKPF